MADPHFCLKAAVFLHQLFQLKTIVAFCFICYGIQKSSTLFFVSVVLFFDLAMRSIGFTEISETVLRFQTVARLNIT